MPKVQSSLGYGATLFALLAVVGACSAGAPAASPSPSGPSPLTGTSWNLTLLGNAAPTSPATLMFTTDDNAGGLAGCNTFTASYTADSSSLKFGPLAMTRIACDPGVTSFESAYTSALANTTQYTMTADQLVLKSGGGEALLTYAPGSPADIEGSWEVTAFNTGSAITSVALGSTITMDFDADGQVSGNGGCNQYGGGYSVDGSNVSIGPLHSTMMACPDEALGTQESQFLTALDMVETWSLTGDQLTLHGPGETIMVNANASTAAE